MTAATKCANCGAAGASKLCSGCKTARYCHRACQAAHWKSGHKKECQSPSQRGGDLPREIAVGSTHLYLPDEIARNMQAIQGVPFLHTGVVPAVGQRVEVTMRLRDDRDVHFRLSGKVVEVPAEPSPDNVRPMQNENDYGFGKGSMQLANYLGLNNVTNYDPAQCALYWNENKQYDPSRYQRRFDEGLQQMREHYGMLHGQKVVCEARLNFDWDMRRGTDDGPWSDSIPFDGRDIWRFSLVADDSAGCMWIPDPASFVNLGHGATTHRRPRGWPWNDAVDELPYPRTGTDLPFHARRSGRGTILTHMCIGPFGCDGSDHPHSF